MQNAMVVSQLPLDVIGGGEMFTINSFRQLRTLFPEAELWYAMDAQPNLAPHSVRMKQTYTRAILSGEKVTAGAKLQLHDLLMRSSGFDLLAVHQYLSCSSTIDFVTATSPDQRLVLTSLGHEAFQKEFCRVFEPADNVLIAEISKYAAIRSKERGVHAVEVSAGVYSRDIHEVPSSANAACSERRSAVSVGRVLPHKGFDVTIQAVPSNWNLTLVGPPSGDKTYEAYIRKLMDSRSHIQSVGYVDRPLRDQLIQQADALIASSCTTLFDGKKIDQAELFGLVLLEAVAEGTIPIASDIPSFQEVMTHLGLERWLYSQRNISSLNERLHQLAMLSPAQYLNQVRSAQARLKGIYLWDDYWSRIVGNFAAATSIVASSQSLQRAA